MKVLVTGGAGYIGSHTVLELLRLEHEVTVIDDLSNSSIESIRRVEKLSARKVKFYQGNILDKNLLRTVFGRNTFTTVIHFAGYKAVGESIKEPLSYYHNNITGTISLVEEMLKYRVHNLIFSSSATVYGSASVPPYNENSELGQPTSPYGQTKLIIEQVLQDVVSSNSDFKVSSLRYFNPIGADESGEIGEDPKGIPNNLMPFISQVASGKLDKLSIFGSDYKTEDGTCERDYVHVTDLANGHVNALNWIEKQKLSVFEVFNLGTGKPSSVLQMVNSFQQHTKQRIPFEIVDKRPGDLAAFWADVNKAERDLNWSAKKSLRNMMEDTWNWQKNNPNGY
ncbi:MAG: UDP-glucose 4-epimerase GalE [Colwelliaceae bacterium]|nr:UDP-glucose 4-epimerase GalE [Colwelliaceae bacterium]